MTETEMLLHHAECPHGQHQWVVCEKQLLVVCRYYDCHVEADLTKRELARWRTGNFMVIPDLNERGFEFGSAVWLK